MGTEPLGWDETGNSRERRGRSRSKGIVLGSFLLATGLLLGAGQIGADVYQGATYKCIVDGPASPNPEVSERSDVVEGSAALWPLGRACEWARADGAGTVTTYSGNWPSMLAALGLAIGGITVAILTVTRRPPTDHRPAEAGQPSPIGRRYPIS